MEDEKYDIRQHDISGIGTLIIASICSQTMLPLSPGVATAEIPLFDIITDMMEEEETTRAQSGQGED